ncbi:hypothetical protein L1987_78217 [Smallanthus sonchifolius]|uniref:Uncharacterized protein n=1 Tax=Smallanthus sonchifolius TaxID=185202 RepID=A0ACB8ZC19_9ASTR|nr:hypothetical protein L1987_78217 [Smallanthus sonchifolius]
MELQSSDQYYCVVTIGVDAAISAFRLSEDRSRSFVGSILSKVVPATFSTISSFSKLVWRTQQPAKNPEPKPQPFDNNEVMEKGGQTYASQVHLWVCLCERL